MAYQLVLSAIANKELEENTIWYENRVFLILLQSTFR